jgi:hypothetical protein
MDNKYYCSNNLLNPDGSTPWKWGTNSDNAKKYEPWVKSALRGVESSKKEKKKHYQDIHYFKTHMGKLCRGLSNLSGCFHELGKIVTSQKPEWEQLSMIMNLRDQHNRPFINQETAKDIYDTMHMKYIQVGKGRGSDFDDYGEPYCYEKQDGGGEEAALEAELGAVDKPSMGARAATGMKKVGRGTVSGLKGIGKGIGKGLKKIGGLAVSGASAGAQGIANLGSRVMGGSGSSRDDDDFDRDDGYDDDNQGHHHSSGGSGMMGAIDDSASDSLDNIAQDAGNFQSSMNCLGAKLGVQMTNYANQMKQGSQMRSYYDGLENDVNTLPFLHKGFSGGISKEFDIPLNLNDILLMGFSVFPFLGWILDIFMIFRAILEKRWIYAILMVLNWFQWFFWKLFTMGMLNVDLGPFFKLFYVAPYASYFFNAKNIIGTASDLMLEFSGNLPTMISVMMN